MAAINLIGHLHNYYVIGKISLNNECCATDDSTIESYSIYHMFKTAEMNNLIVVLTLL